MNVYYDEFIQIAIINYYKLMGRRSISEKELNRILNNLRYRYPEILVLDNDIYDKSLQAISNCDMLIIGGTSLAVYPASYLINYFKGKYLVLINKEKTPFDNKATLVINDSLGYVFDYIDKNCI